MSTTDLFFVAVAFFAGVFIAALYGLFKKNEKNLALRGAIVGINKLVSLENLTPDQQAKAAADEAHTQALKNALKDAAAKL
jgi:hypothetical protein